ncbi:hypothetical protein BASA81_000693 [Batrachochytrium salamandrivorans]|nr:hypothetical protein BASA81_000693 [Batrachochytrium salamandrivorans]
MDKYSVWIGSSISRSTTSPAASTASAFGFVYAEPASGLHPFASLSSLAKPNSICNIPVLTVESVVPSAFSERASTQSRRCFPNMIISA